MKRLVIPIVAMCAMADASGADNGAGELRVRLDSIFEERYAEGAEAPGGAVIIARGDTVLYERYFGTADLETGERVGPETLFNIASVSKQFTVMGLLRLAKLGAVDMNDTVAKYVDYPQEFWKEITLADLAGHTSGLPDARDRSDRMRTILANDSTSIAYFPEVKELKFKPGTAYDYLNPSFLILARIIEEKSGMKFTDYQKKYVFGPAGMERAVYFDPEGMPAHTAHGYELAGGTATATTDSDKPAGAAEAAQGQTEAKRYEAGGKEWEELDYGEETFFATRPDGGIYATARDMLAWERALATGDVVGPGMVEYAYRPRIEVYESPWSSYQNRPYTWYGQGFFIDRNPDYTPTVYHTGDNGGFQAYVAKLPELEEGNEPTVVIVLENRHDRDRWTMARAVTDELMKAAAGE